MVSQRTFTEDELVNLKAHIEAIQQFQEKSLYSGIFMLDDISLNDVLEDIASYIKHRIHNEPYPQD